MAERLDPDKLKKTSQPASSSKEPQKPQAHPLDLLRSKGFVSEESEVMPVILPSGDYSPVYTPNDTLAFPSPPRRRY